VENPEIFNAALDYIKKREQPPTNKVVLPNTIFIAGDAGAGKSTVCGRNIANYLNNEEIWLSTPANT
jgi:signal recognition particle GTPase